MKHFEARLSPFLLGVTIVIAAVFLGFAAYNLYAGHPVTAAALVGLLLFFSLFSIRGYAVQEERLLVKRPGWTTEIDLSSLTEASIEPDILRHSFSLWSTRGLFGVAGYAYKREVGRCRVYVTDPKKTILLRFSSGKNVVVSPHSPEKFLLEIRSESIPVS